MLENLFVFGLNYFCRPLPPEAKNMPSFLPDEPIGFLAKMGTSWAIIRAL